jgi:uncharacterized protein (TIGR03437 family)
MATAALLAASVGQAQNYTVATIAGGSARTGTPASMASLAGNDSGLAVDAAGNLYISDSGANVIRKVTPSGAISVVAGDVTKDSGGFYGDGGPAIGAGLNGPGAIALDSGGNLYISDLGNNRVRKVSTNGTISTVAGGGTSSTLGGQATRTYLPLVGGLAVDSSNNVYVGTSTGSGASGQVVKIAPSGTVTAFAGNPSVIYSPTNIGDGGPATGAFIALTGLAADTAGNVYIADAGDNRVRKVSSNGIITTIAGTNASNYSGDGGPASSAGLSTPRSVAVDSSGNIYIDDSGDYRIRKVTPDGTITTIAGTGSPGNTGDGGPAASATINSSSTIATGNGGFVYFTDVRASDGAGIIRVLEPIVAAPSISSGGVAPLNSPLNSIQPGEWVSIYGTNLANGTATWNGDFPTSLGGTTVTIDNKPAYLWYASPGQINLQAPDDTATGTVSVVVKTAGGSAMSNVTLGPFGPSFNLLDGKHVAALILRSDGSGAYGGGTYDIAGPTGTSLGYKTVAAKAGDAIELFGVGFGPTNPVVPAGKAFSGAAATTNPVQLLINNVPVPLGFSGLTSAGLYQLNITQLPASLGTGDVPLQATVGGVKTPSGVFFSLQ